MYNTIEVQTLFGGSFMAGKPWTDEEKKLVEEKYPYMKNKDIGRLIGRTERAIDHLGSINGWEKIEPKIGDKYGKLTIKEIFLKRVGRQQKSFARCDCECGKTGHTTLLTGLFKGRVYSCGCYVVVKARDRMIVYNDGGHKMKHTKIYNRWSAMISRCYNKNTISYKNYGGQGIIVCEEWRDFTNYLKWAMANGYDDSLTIDRIDVHGNYCPENCRFVDRKVQNNNKRSNVRYEAWGEVKTISEWLDDPRCIVDNYNLVSERVKLLGWSLERAITTPNRNEAIIDNQYSNEKYEALGEVKSLLEWSHDSRCVVSYSVLYYRVVSQKQDIIDAMSIPSLYAGTETKNYLYSGFGETKSLKDWFNDHRCVVSYNTLQQRLQVLQWDLETSLTTPSQRKNF